MSGRTPARGTFAPVWIALLALAGAGTAWAHQDPPGCSGTGVAITFEVFRADGVTPVDLTQSVTECETIVYSVSLAPSGTGSGTPCAFEGGTITITTPDGMPHDVTPSGGVPCIGGTIAGGCDATSVTSDPLRNTCASPNGTARMGSVYSCSAQRRCFGIRKMTGSSPCIAVQSNPAASAGVLGMRMFRPG